MRIRLKVPYRAETGGMCYPGEVINVDRASALEMVIRGEAEEIDAPIVPAAATAPKPEHAAMTTETAAPMVAPVTKPVTDPGALRGDAKRAWLKSEIRKRGAAPDGNTIAALTAQLKSLGD